MFKIKIANVVIMVDNIYHLIERYCMNFITEDEKVDIYVKSTLSKINKEKEYVKEEYSNDIHEVTSVHREICNELLKFDVLFIHASSIAYNDFGLLFLGLSGTGKSTHSRMWKERYPSEVTYIDDDKPLLRKIDGNWMICGTPWNGKHHLGSNKMVLLKAICEIKRSTINKTYLVNPKDILKRIFNQIIVPKKMKELDITLKLLDDVLMNSKQYIIECDISHKASEVAKMVIFEEEK